MAKVLVIDDSLSVRKVVERALVGRQIEVVCAATGTEALERIEREAPDIVVCDVVMPDRDGYEICEYIKPHPRLSRTPVLLMSGIVNDEVRARAARVQSADVLSKPFAAEDLVRRLEALLAAGAPGVPARAGADPGGVAHGAASHAGPSGAVTARGRPRCGGGGDGNDVVRVEPWPRPHPAAGVAGAGAASRVRDPRL